MHALTDNTDRTSYVYITDNMDRIRFTSNCIDTPVSE